MKDIASQALINRKGGIHQAWLGRSFHPVKAKVLFLRIQEQHRGCFCGHRGYTGVQNGLDNFTEVQGLSDFGTHSEVSVEVSDLLIVGQPVKKLADKMSQQGGNLPQENLPGQIIF